MKLRPTGDRVLVQPLPAAETTKGGIHLSSAYQNPSGQGIIIAVGGRVTDEALKPGVRIFYNWIDGRDVQHQGINCKLLDVPNLLGVADR